VSWWWLLFAVADKRPVGRSLVTFGIVIVDAHTADEALGVVKVLGCGPSAPTLMFDVRMLAEDGDPPTGCANRLLADVEARQVLQAWIPGAPHMDSIVELARMGHPLALDVMGWHLAS
jgi:hypothetical protein